MALCKQRLDLLDSIDLTAVGMLEVLELLQQMQVFLRQLLDHHAISLDEEGRGGPQLMLDPCDDHVLGRQRKVVQWPVAGVAHQIADIHEVPVFCKRLLGHLPFGHLKLLLNVFSA